jgi:hypothetical protein
MIGSRSDLKSYSRELDGIYNDVILNEADSCMNIAMVNINCVVEVLIQRSTLSDYKSSTLSTTHYVLFFASVETVLYNVGTYIMNRCKKTLEGFFSEFQCR